MMALFEFNEIFARVLILLVSLSRTKEKKHTTKETTGKKTTKSLMRFLKHWSRMMFQFGRLPRKWFGVLYTVRILYEFLMQLFSVYVVTNDKKW